MLDPCEYEFDSDVRLARLIREEREENRKVLERTGEGFIVHSVKIGGQTVYAIDKGGR